MAAGNGGEEESLLLTDFSTVTTSNLILCRSLITANYEHPYKTIPKNRLNYAEGEKMFLWFPEACQENFNSNSMEKVCSGIVLLEGRLYSGVGNGSCRPLAILYFTCSKKRRNELMLNSTIPLQCFLNGTCRCVWLSRTLRIGCVNKINEWPFIYQMAERVWHQRDITSGQLVEQYKATHFRNCILNNYMFVNNIQKWLEITRITTISGSVWDEFYEGQKILKDDKRQLTHTEVIWLFVRVNMRITERYVNSVEFIRNVAAIRILKSVPRGNAGRVLSFNDQHLKEIARVGLKNKSGLILQQYKNQESISKLLELRYKGQVLDETLKLRRQLYSAPIHTARIVDKLTEGDMTSMPCDIFQKEYIDDWINNCQTKVQTQLDPNAIYKNIYTNAKCVKVRGPLNLYGNHQLLVAQTAASNDTRVVVDKYIVRCGHKMIDLSPAYQSLTISHQLYDEKPSARTSGVVLTQAGLLTTPVWFVWNKLGDASRSPVFHTCQPVPSLKRGNRLSEKDIVSLLLSFTQQEKYCHECVNALLHVSCLVLDIDMKFVSQAQFEHRQEPQIFQDLCDMVTEVFLSLDIVNEANELTHYMYKSQKVSEVCVDATSNPVHVNEDEYYEEDHDYQLYCDDSEDEIYNYSVNADASEQIAQTDEKQDVANQKLGVHYHVCLPPGTVLTVDCAKSLCTIFNQIRFLYKHIGVELDGDLVDPVIYNGKHHFVRMPYMLKPDNNMPLRCVFRSDSQPLNTPTPPLTRFIHAPHLVAGKSILYGTVVTSVGKVSFIDDKSVITNAQKDSLEAYAVRKTNLSSGHIRYALNSRCVLFLDRNQRSTVNDKVSKCIDGRKPDLLQQIVEEIWHTKKDDLIRKWGENRSNNDRTILRDHVVLVQEGQFYLVEHNSQDTYTNICLHKEHSNPNTTRSQIKIVYTEGMINLTLWGACHKCPNRRMNPTCLLPFTKMGITITVLSAFQKTLQAVVKNPNNDVRDIDGDTPEVHRLLNDVKSVSTLLMIDRNMIHLYAFIPSRFVCFQNSSGRYFALVISRNQTKIFTSIKCRAWFSHLYKCVLDKDDLEDWNLLLDLHRTLQQLGEGLPDIHPATNWAEENGEGVAGLDEFLFFNDSDGDEELLLAAEDY